MSALTDRRRREDAHEAAVERGKSKLRVLQSVLTHFTEGLSARESATRLGVSARSVERHRSTLDLGLWVDAVETDRAG